MEQRMLTDPYSYRVYNVSEDHCRQFIGKGDSGYSLYCGLLDCTINHEEAVRNNINKGNIGDFSVYLHDITLNGVAQLSLWNRVTRKHVEEETDNLLNLISSYTRYYHFYKKCSWYWE